jgi:class 3 adenylate cyclase/tetratricopeptide (TPR) repeat protein
MGNRRSGFALAPYVPRVAAEWDLDAPGQTWRALDATCCFVDISGFTALSERLARRGRVGAEELTEVLNHVFSAMLEVAYGKGGALLKFGGDALLLAFTGDDHARLAAESAVAMRAALREARTLPTSVGRVNLRMSVGVHSGMFHMFRVGDPRSHREVLITGPAATATTLMEQTADAGEIVVSGDTADRLPPGAVGEAKGDGHLLRWRRVVPDGPGPIPARLVTDANVEGAVPVGLRTRLALGTGESEHRLASVGFVKFKGVDALLTSRGPEATAEALHAIVRAVQEAAAAESVTFLASDIDADGGKIILTTGVPATQEDDEGRLLRAVRHLMDQPLPLPVRVGVNRGHVFAGDIGTGFRRTFTVMGDPVNLAARLMAQASPGEAYATAGVLDHSHTLFGTEALEPFMVKGKSEPVQAFRVGAAVGARAGTYGSLPFRGRDKEMAALVGAFESADSGRGGTALIEAERGSGKTRLLAEFVGSLGSPGTTLWLQGEAQDTGVPYQPLRAAMRTVLSIDATDREEAGTQLLSSMARLDAALVPLAPLLAPLVDAEVTSTPESDSVAEQFVRSRIAELVVTTLDAACTAPLLVVAEDAHWFDDTTSDICTRLASAAASRRWLVCVARRPDAEGGFTPAEPDTLLALEPLTEDVALELVDVATDTAPLRPHERDVVVARAGGNPLFLDELLRIVRETDVDSLPDTLDAVAMREIDALAPTPRRVLRLASVLGRSFDRRRLHTLLVSESVETGPDPLAELGGQLVTNGDEEVRFRHALLQEAAYQSLPFRQRLELHRKVGEAMERETADPDTVAPLLSLHFLTAQDWERTWRYARRAARVAREAHAHGEEAVHLERAVLASRRIGVGDENERAAVFGDLGTALELLGEYDRADQAYRDAASATRDPLRRGQMACRRAYLRTEFLGRPSAAIRQARAARTELETAGRRAAGLRAQLLAEESDARYRQGRLVESIECAGRAVEEAEAAGEKGALALALHAHSVCLVRMGRVAEADAMTRVLHLYEEIGNDVKVAVTLGNIATVAFFTSQWDKAAEYLERSIEASTKVGDLAGAALAQGNLGELRTNQGRLDEALAALTPARRTLESFGYPIMAAGAAMQLGRATAFGGDVEGGLGLIRSALMTFDEIGASFEALEALARTAEVLVFAGRFAEARAELGKARVVQRGLGETPLSALIERIGLTLAAASGEGPPSASELADFRALAERLDATYDELVVLALSERLGHGDRHDEVVRLTRDLGVVRLPMLPAT